MKFQIIESNLPIAEVKMHITPDFTDVTAVDVSCLNIDTLKDNIIHTLDKYTNFITEVMQKHEDSDAKHRLFIAWEDVSGYQYDAEDVLMDCEN